jgi:hypothetical protein
MRAKGPIYEDNGVLMRFLKARFKTIIYAVDSIFFEDRKFFITISIIISKIIKCILYCYLALKLWAGASLINSRIKLPDKLPDKTPG